MARGKPVPEEKWREVEEALLNTMSLVRACEVTGVSRPAIENKMKADPAFRERVMPFLVHQAKLSPAWKHIAVEIMREDGRESEIIRKLEISVYTLEKAKERDPKFREELEKARRQAWERNLYDAAYQRAIVNGDTKMITFMMQYLWPDKKVEGSVEMRGTLKVQWEDEQKSKDKS